MDKFLAVVGGLVVLALAFLLAPIGIAVALEWQPNQTNALLTGGFSVCGGAVAITGLAFGLAAGINLMQERKRVQQQRDQNTLIPPPTPYDVGRGLQPASAMEFLKQQKLMQDIQRQQLVIERERQALLPKPPQQEEEPDLWSVTTDWAYLDSVSQQSDNGGGDW